MLLLIHRGTIRRLKPVGTNGRRSQSDLYKNVPCLLLPMSDTATIRHNFTLGRSFDIYFDACQDVRVGDQVVLDDETYNVRGIKKYKVPAVGHVQVLCEQELS